METEKKHKKYRKILEVKKKLTNPEKIVCIRKRLADFDIVFVETDYAGYQELIKKLKLEYLQERQGMLLSGKALRCQEQILVKVEKTVISGKVIFAKYFIISFFSD